MAAALLFVAALLAVGAVSGQFSHRDVFHFNASDSLFLDEASSISLLHSDHPASPFKTNWTSSEEKLTHYALHGYLRSLTSFSTSPFHHHRLHNQSFDIKESLKVVTKQYDLITDVNNGLKAYGFYYLQLKMGTPPVDQILVFDTSSDLSWVQCKGCLQCSSPSFQSYNPSRSKSDRIFKSCKDKPCNDNKIGAWCSVNTCNYNAFIGDLGRSTGTLGTERFIFGIVNSKKLIGVKSVLFGCGLQQTNIPPGPNGVAAFGLGNSAIPNQFSKLLKRRAFTSCLVRSDFNEAASLLFMGKSAVPSRGIKYTPMLPNPALKFPKHYVVQVIKVQVGKTTLKFPASAWQYSSRTGSGGVILDTSTSFNYLLKSAIAPLAAAIKKNTKLGSATRQGVFPICFKHKFVSLSRLNQLFPKITFTFKGGVTVKLSGYHYVKKYSKTIVCTTFLRSVTSNNIFGNYFQQNLLVIYDIAKSRIGFRAVDCVTRKPLE